MQNKPLFVTGIGTGVGKTIVSAVLCEQLKTDYWKPVQSGDLHRTDSHRVKRLIRNQQTFIHTEEYRLEMAASPHKSAKAQGIEIVSSAFKLPRTDNDLLIEGVGGLFVPLSSSFLMTDLIKQLDAEVVLVTRNYLGCINHTLLSLHALASLNIPLKHVVFNGPFLKDIKEVILQHLPAATTWSDLPQFTRLSKAAIASAPTQLINLSTN
ncbi:dethiobiotin synthase [Pedobacter hartonius]|uniref:ATP-dependent dethiobiotin synthetase BioD n=1 Tax=Pedobacter hartonius TaxID=425514 RepID=A0A1H4HG11_9SPHI|nr:dethiobiotin synthase [Pedobacter hartonius]SEB19968.1 dethiobiotin synthetase [Pedobacter hartonius]